MKVYKPRLDFVLFRIVDKGIVGRVAVPQISAQGKEITIVAIGPDVKNLDVGDKVFVCGRVGEDVVPLPDNSDLYLTKQSNVMVVVEDSGDENGSVISNG